MKTTDSPVETEAEVLLLELMQVIWKSKTRNGLKVSSLVRSCNGTPQGQEDDTFIEMEEKLLAILQRQFKANYAFTNHTVGGILTGEKHVLMSLGGKLDRLRILDIENGNLKKRLLDAEARAEGVFPKVLVNSNSYHEKIDIKTTRKNEEIVALSVENLVDELKEIGYNISVTKEVAHVL